VKVGRATVLGWRPSAGGTSSWYRRVRRHHGKSGSGSPPCAVPAGLEPATERRRSGCGAARGGASTAAWSILRRENRIRVPVPHMCQHDGGPTTWSSRACSRARNKRSARKRPRGAATELGIPIRRDAAPARRSGGEQQRVGVERRERPTSRASCSTTSRPATWTAPTRAT